MLNQEEKQASEGMICMISCETNIDLFHRRKMLRDIIMEGQLVRIELLTYIATPKTPHQLVLPINKTFRILLHSCLSLIIQGLLRQFKSRERNRIQQKRRTSLTDSMKIGRMFTILEAQSHDLYTARGLYLKR